MIKEWLKEFLEIDKLEIQIAILKRSVECLERDFEKKFENLVKALGESKVFLDKE